MALVLGAVLAFATFAATGQNAAVPVHCDNRGRSRVLSGTSRDTGGWVKPKGWLMGGVNPVHAAKIDAVEDAGAAGRISNKSVGVYHHAKGLKRDDVFNARSRHTRRSSTGLIAAGKKAGNANDTGFRSKRLQSSPTKLS